MYAIMSKQDILKPFVNDNPECKQLIRYLSYVVSFPVSEALVETCGSVIEHIINHRANAKNGDVSDPGTVEQRVFLHLNGPPAGSSLNVKFLNRALIIMYKGDVSRHFTHSQRYLRFSSKVTARIHDSQNSPLLQRLNFP